MRLALAFLSLCVALTAGAQDKVSKKKAGGHPLSWLSLSTVKGTT